jgi:hypothetical protein
MRVRIAALAGVLAGSGASAATFIVPTEYPTIHAAMAVASSGDTVLVLPGTYGDFEVRPVFGDVAALGFPIDGVTLASEAGPESTILDMSGGEGLAPVVLGLWIGGVGVGVTTVHGFKITGAPESGDSGIILRSSQNVVISECIFELDDPGPATDVFRGGLNCILSSGEVEDCRFMSCRGHTGAGLWQLGGTFTVERTVFEDCQNEAIDVSDAQMTIVRDCVFDSNVVVAGIYGSGAISGMSPGIIEDCVFVRNEGYGYGAVVAGNVQVRGCLFDANHAVGLPGAALTLGGHGNVIENNTVVHSVHSFPGLGGSAIGFINSTGNMLRNNIIAFSSGSPAVGVTNGSVTSQCNVFWENADGNGDGFVLGPTDREVDPLFCDPDAPDWRLREGSPCLPEDPSGCGLIGAFPQGCGVIGIEGVSFGEIKNRYRDANPKEK